MLNSAITVSMNMYMDFVPANFWQHGAYIVIPEIE